LTQIPELENSLGYVINSSSFKTCQSATRLVLANLTAKFSRRASRVARADNAADFLTWFCAMKFSRG